jgi:hypothetical protein
MLFNRIISTTRVLKHLEVVAFNLELTMLATSPLQALTLSLKEETLA